MRLLLSAIAVLFLFGDCAAAQQAEFNSATGVLTIPEVSVDGQAYRNATFQYDGGLSFRLTGIDGPGASGQCSEDNINFTRYATLPGFYTPVTEADLNALIGCTGTLTAQGTSSYLRWSLPSSTESCPRYIEAELYLDSSSNWAINGRQIAGINSDTNQPYDCQ